MITNLTTKIKLRIISPALASITDLKRGARQEPKQKQDLDHLTRHPNRKEYRWMAKEVGIGCIMT